MRHWKPNQKLTDSQIQTIKHLKDNGVELSIIATTVSQQYQVSKCLAYYHASDNREAYDPKVKEQRLEEKQLLRDHIRGMIEQGMTTYDIARLWGKSLEEVNKLYAR